METSVKKGWNEDASYYECSDGRHSSWWKAIIQTEEWQSWAKEARDKYDMGEVEECGWMSAGHANDFMKFVRELKSYK